MESNATNDSVPLAVEWLPGLQITACIFYSIILCVGIMGNILVIVIVTKYRDMRNATNLLLANLSVADLFLLLFCTPDGYQHLYARDKHQLGKFMCSFSPFVQNTTSICSVLTIMAISYERYIAICKPLKTSPLHINLFRTLPAVILFWIVSCIVSIPFFRYSQTEVESATYNETITTCFTVFPPEWSNQYLIACTLCPYFIIIILLSYWHFSICSILFNREALLRDNTVVTRYRRQVAQLLIILIISFFVLILPQKIWAFIQQRLNYTQLIEIGFHRHSLIIISTRALLYLNSAINPILYSVLSTKFRQSLVSLCKGCSRVSKPRQHGDMLYLKGSTFRHGMDMNRTTACRTMSTTAKGSSCLVNGIPAHEKRSLLTDNIPHTIKNLPMREKKFYISG